MTLESLKSSVLLYITHFSMQDYVAYAWLILIFFVLIVLSIFLAKKSALISIITFFLALCILFIGPFILKHYLDLALRPTKIVSEYKKLNFTDALIVTGTLSNISQKNFSLCNLHIAIVQETHNKWKNYITALKPLAQQTISIQEELKVNEMKDFRVVFDNYRYSQDINLSTTAECY